MWLKKQKLATRRAEDCHWSLPGGFTRPGSAQLDGQEGRVQPGPTQHQVRGDHLKQFYLYNFSGKWWRWRRRRWWSSSCTTFLSWTTSPTTSYPSNKVAKALPHQAGIELSDFHARGWKSDQGGRNSMQEMHGNQTKCMEFRPIKENSNFWTSIFCPGINFSCSKSL